jgi:hypothetical protein
MKYTINMISDAMLYISSFIKIGLNIQNLIGVEFIDTQTTWRWHKINLFFSKWEKYAKM